MSVAVAQNGGEKPASGGGVAALQASLFGDGGPSSPNGAKSKATSNGGHSPSAKKSSKIAGLAGMLGGGRGIPLGGFAMGAPTPASKPPARSPRSAAAASAGGDASNGSNSATRKKGRSKTLPAGFNMNMGSMMMTPMSPDEARKRVRELAQAKNASAKPAALHHAALDRPAKSPRTRGRSRTRRRRRAQSAATATGTGTDNTNSSGRHGGGGSGGAGAGAGWQPLGNERVSSELDLSSLSDDFGSSDRHAAEPFSTDEAKRGNKRASTAVSPQSMPKNPYYSGTDVPLATSTKAPEKSAKEERAPFAEKASEASADEAAQSSLAEDPVTDEDEHDDEQKSNGLHTASDETPTPTATLVSGEGKDTHDKAFKEAAVLAERKSRESAEKAAAKEKAKEKNRDLKGELASAAEERRGLRKQRRFAAEAAAEAARAIETRLASSALKLEQARLAETLISARQHEEDEKARKAKAEALKAQAGVEAQRKREKEEKAREEAETRRRQKEEAEKEKLAEEAAAASGSESQSESEPVSLPRRSPLKSALKVSPSHSSPSSSRNSPQRTPPQRSPRRKAGASADMPPFSLARTVSFSVPDISDGDESDSSANLLRRNGVAKPVRRPNMQRLQSLADLSFDASDSDEGEGAFPKPNFRPKVSRLASMAELSPASDSDDDEGAVSDAGSLASSVPDDSDLMASFVSDFSMSFSDQIFSNSLDRVMGRFAEEEYVRKQAEAAAAERDAREAAKEAQRVAEMRRHEEECVAKDSKRLAEMSQLMADLENQSDTEDEGDDDVAVARKKKKKRSASLSMVDSNTQQNGEGDDDGPPRGRLDRSRSFGPTTPVVVRTRPRRYDLSNSHKSPEIEKFAHTRTLSGGIGLLSRNLGLGSGSNGMSSSLVPKKLKSALKAPLSTGRKPRHRRARSGMVSAADLSQLVRSASGDTSEENKSNQDTISMSAGLLAVAGSGRVANKQKDTRSLEAAAAALFSLQKLSGTTGSESEESKGGDAAGGKEGADSSSKPKMKLPSVGVLAPRPIGIIRAEAAARRPTPPRPRGPVKPSRLARSILKPAIEDQLAAQQRRKQAEKERVARENMRKAQAMNRDVRAISDTTSDRKGSLKALSESQKTPPKKLSSASERASVAARRKAARDSMKRLRKRPVKRPVEDTPPATSDSTADKEPPKEVSSKPTPDSPKSQEDVSTSELPSSDDGFEGSLSELRATMSDNENEPGPSDRERSASAPVRKSLTAAGDTSDSTAKSSDSDSATISSADSELPLIQADSDDEDDSDHDSDASSLSISVTSPRGTRRPSVKLTTPPKQQALNKRTPPVVRSSSSSSSSSSPSSGSQSSPKTSSPAARRGVAARRSVSRRSPTSAANSGAENASPSQSSSSAPPPKRSPTRKAAADRKAADKPVPKCVTGEMSPAEKRKRDILRKRREARAAAAAAAGANSDSPPKRRAPPIGAGSGLASSDEGAEHRSSPVQRKRRVAARTRPARSGSESAAARPRRPASASSGTTGEGAAKAPPPRRRSAGARPASRGGASAPSRRPRTASETGAKRVRPVRRRSPTSGSPSSASATPVRRRRPRGSLSSSTGGEKSPLLPRGGGESTPKDKAEGASKGRQCPCPCTIL